MKKTIIILAFLISYCSGFAQNSSKISIKGSVVDSLSKPLESATVLLLSSKDSSLVNFARTNEKGTFELKSLENNSYFIKISFVGYANFTQIVQKATANLLDLGEIKMQPIEKELAGIIVKADAIPVEINGDTINYNAAAFKTKPNAVVEDLLKKLPGVQVNRDGSVMAQGEKVQKVTVDGKEFFGKDPKIATQNLPADAINKVQVFDKKSDQSMFTGIDDGKREKTINLQLKEEKKKMFFGSVMGGGGTNERFDSKINLNKFNKTKQFSVLGIGNNINKQGFSIDEYLNFTGEMQRMMAGGGGQIKLEFNSNDQNGIPLDFGGRPVGFMKSFAGGVNFNDQLTKKAEINGSHFFNSLNNVIEKDLVRQNFLPDKNYTTTQNSLQNNQNTNHRVNFALDQKIDSLNSLRLTSNISFNETNLRASSTSKNIAENNVLMNEGTRNNFSQGNGTNMTTNLLFRHKFMKKGRTFSANFNLGINENTSNGTLDAVNKFYTNTTQIDSIKQTNSQDSKFHTFGVNLSYTEPITKRKYLEFLYNFSKNLNDVNREVYDLSKDKPILNQLLSNQFSNIYTYNRVGVNFRLNNKKYNFSTGLAFQESDLDGKILSKNISIQKSFSNFLPNFHTNYSFSGSQNLNLDYEATMREPSLNELNPIPDNSNPLNIYVGNTELRPEYVHRMRLHFNAFNQVNYTNFFSAIGFTYTTNKISNSQQINDALVTTNQPINVRNDYNLQSNFNYGFRLKKIDTRVNLGANLTYIRGINFINTIENTTKRFIEAADARIEYKFKEIFDFALLADWQYNQTQYTLNQALSQKYLDQTYGFETNLTLPKNWQFSSNLDYLIFASYNQTVPLLNASLSKFFLKGNRGELKLSVVDLLNKNIGISRHAEVNYVQDERTRSLGRYFLMSFTYSLRGKSAGGMSGQRNIIKMRL